MGDVYDQLEGLNPTTINEVRRARVLVFRAVKRELRTLDTQIEKTQRLIDRYLQRKDKLPEAIDYVRLGSMVTDIFLSYRSLAGTMTEYASLFDMSGDLWMRD